MIEFCGRHGLDFAEKLKMEQRKFMKD